MCTEVEYMGRTIDTIGKAKKYLGEAHVVVCGGYTIDTFTSDNLCCCAIDWHETAKLMNYALVNHGTHLELCRNAAGISGLSAFWL